MRCPPFGATRLCVLEFYRCLGQGFVGHLGFEVTGLDTFKRAYLAFWPLNAVSRSSPLLPDSGWCEWYLKLRGFYFYNLSPLAPRGVVVKFQSMWVHPPKIIQRRYNTYASFKALASLLRTSCKPIASSLQAPCKPIASRYILIASHKWHSAGVCALAHFRL